MKYAILFFGFLMVSFGAEAQVAKSIGCTAYVASDSSTGDLKDAPPISLKSKPNNVGGNSFTGLLQRGNTVYSVLIETEESALDNTKVLIRTFLKKSIDRNKIQEVPVRTESGYTDGFKIYYGDNDVLIYCAEPVI